MSRGALVRTAVQVFSPKKDNPDTSKKSTDFDWVGFYRIGFYKTKIQFFRILVIVISFSIVAALFGAPADEN